MDAQIIVVPNVFCVSGTLIYEPLKRSRLASGDITVNEFEKNIAYSNFNYIPYWEHANPFERNYTVVMDKTYKERLYIS